jgi:PPM family protein phosphatase
MEIGRASHVGKVRERNEDAFHADPGRGLMVVADGIGGGPAGDVASRMAVEFVVDALRGRSADEEEGPTLSEVLVAANDALMLHASGDVRRHGMGTTAVVAMVSPSERILRVAHVGDSRAYLYREGRLHRITNDHDAGGLFGPNSISQALGVSEGVVPDEILVELEEDDRILLCTDGLTDLVDDRAIAGVLGGQRPSQPAVDTLVELALTHGGKDNVTVVVADVRTSDVVLSTPPY